MNPHEEAARYFDLDATPAPVKEIFPGVRIRVLAGDAIMLSLVELDEGAVVPTHSHPHEQMGMLIAGTLEFTVAGVTRKLVAGDRWRIPGGVPHSVKAEGGPAKALDVFHPIRADYL